MKADVSPVSMRTRILALPFAALTIIAPLAATASPEFKPLVGTLIRARCHMNTCGWFSIDAADLIGASSKGQLYVLATRYWESSYPDNSTDLDMARAPREGGEMTISFIFCSKQKPAFIDHSKDGMSWGALLLQPGNSLAMSGVREAQYAMYWAACHNAIVQDVYGEGDRLGKKLGYRFSGESDDNLPEDEPLASPFDVLKW